MLNARRTTYNIIVYVYCLFGYLCLIHLLLGLKNTFESLVWLLLLLLLLDWTILHSCSSVVLVVVGVFYFPQTQFIKMSRIVHSSTNNIYICYSRENTTHKKKIVYLALDISQDCTHGKSAKIPYTTVERIHKRMPCVIRTIKTKQKKFKIKNERNTNTKTTAKKNCSVN